MILTRYIYQERQIDKLVLIYLLNRVLFILENNFYVEILLSKSQWNEYMILYLDQKIKWMSLGRNDE